MANKRMLSREIVKTDAFMTMPLTAQALYMHLVMDADDEGFVASPKTLLRATGASEDDLRILISKNFVIAFESGVLVIKHWKIHNHITESRVKETNFLEEKALLRIKSNNAYTLSEDGFPIVSKMQADCTQSASKMLASIGQSRLGQNRLGQNRLEQYSSSSVIDLLTDEEYDSLLSQVTNLSELLARLEAIDPSTVKKPYSYCLKVAKEAGLA